MASWRDTTSELAQSDMDGLLDIAVELATEQLRKQGGFVPFAACVDDQGEVQLLMAEPTAVDDSADGPDATTLAEGLRVDLRARRESFRGAALAVDVRLPDEGRDGISVDLEHRDGVALLVTLPYTHAGGAVELGDVAASAGTVRIWA